MLPDRPKHAGHERVARVRTSGQFAGKRLRTEIERCRTCHGLLLSIYQVEERRQGRAA
jgi:hypothetical protein